jgi:hypothetical protein
MGEEKHETLADELVDMIYLNPRKNLRNQLIEFLSKNLPVSSDEQEKFLEKTKEKRFQSYVTSCVAGAMRESSLDVFSQLWSESFEKEQKKIKDLSHAVVCGTMLRKPGVGLKFDLLLDIFYFVRCNPATEIIEIFEKGLETPKTREAGFELLGAILAIVRLVESGDKGATSFDMKLLEFSDTWRVFCDQV